MPMTRTDTISSEAGARLLFDKACQAIVSIDREGFILDANPMAERLFGYKIAELKCMSVDALIPESMRGRHRDLREEYERRPRTRTMGIGMDLVAHRKDGSDFPVEIGLSHLPEEGITVAFISDISQRKKASQERETLILRLESALGEKTVLLKEINHRVKNNLSVISALLGMQADEIENEQARSALSDSQQRVLSMALVQEYLYADEHLDRVNFGKYMRQLADQIGAAWMVDPDRIRVSVEAEEVDIPVTRAIPAGLILNELLSNAFKHAFPDGRSGNIDLRFTKLDARCVSLSCQDNGVGIPEGFDWQHAESLGLRIIQILAKQIDGTLTLDRTRGGTRFEILFPAQDA